VHLNGKAVRSCSVPVEAAANAEITTIEGLGGSALNPVQQAWIDHQVPQCGYCQSGMIMAVSAFLATNPAPTDEQLAAAITNICRCGTYARIREAVQSLAQPGKSPLRADSSGIGVLACAPGDAPIECAQTGCLWYRECAMMTTRRKFLIGTATTAGVLIVSYGFWPSHRH
jgi:xanthine dehydrogenase iron-sulfur cluster and FAD-binding subunit A